MSLNYNRILGNFLVKFVFEKWFFRNEPTANFSETPFKCKSETSSRNSEFKVIFRPD